MRLFISYSRVDKYRCREIVDTLKIIHDVWYDEHLHVGQEWWKEIENHLAWCEGFIYLLSPESISSKYCRREFAIALKQGKVIFPVLVRARTEQHEQFPPELSQRNWIDLTGGLNASNVSKLRDAIIIAHQPTAKPQEAAALAMPAERPLSAKPKSPSSRVIWLLPAVVFILIFIVIVAVFETPDRLSSLANLLPAASTTALPAIATTPPTITTTPPAITTPVCGIGSCVEFTSLMINETMVDIDNPRFSIERNEELKIEQVDYQLNEAAAAIIRVEHGGLGDIHLYAFPQRHGAPHIRVSNAVSLDPGSGQFSPNLSWTVENDWGFIDLQIRHTTPYGRDEVVGEIRIFLIQYDTGQ